jgi:photosystem II stability/assembly factor-like uncharacterized protein
VTVAHGNPLRSRRWLWATGAVALALVTSAAGLGGFVRSRSDNGCISGLRYMEPAGTNRIESVVASTSHPSRIYVTTGDGKLYVGTRGQGFRWRKLAAQPPGPLVASVGKSDVLYAKWNALFRSRDGGRSWQRLTCGLLVSDVAVSERNPSTIYLATNQELVGPRGGGVYRTTDGGQTWKRFTKFARMHPDSDQHGVDVVAVSPNQSQRVYAGREFGGLDFSRDGGDNWDFTRVARVEFGDGPQITALAFGRAGRSLWASSRGDGVFVGNSDAPRWRYRGLNGWGVDQVMASQRMANLVYVVAGRICASALSYAECAKADTGGPALRTLDGGAHWKRMKGLPNEIVGLTLQPLDDTLYAWGGRTLLRSRDHGASWTVLPGLISKPRP